jgi:hypothetical protein
MVARCASIGQEIAIRRLAGTAVMLETALDARASGQRFDAGRDHLGAVLPGRPAPEVVN